MTRNLRKGRPLPIKGQALGETLSSGLLMALGIAAKTYILLVEYVLAAEKERKMSRFEALLDAAQAGAADCHDLPIAMTFDRNSSER